MRSGAAPAVRARRFSRGRRRGPAAARPGRAAAGRRVRPRAWPVPAPPGPPGEGRQQVGQPGVSGAAPVGQQRPSLVGEGDEAGPPVRGITDPGGQVLPFQALDELAHRRLGHAFRGGERRQPGRTFTFQPGHDRQRGHAVAAAVGDMAEHQGRRVLQPLDDDVSRARLTACTVHAGRCITSLCSRPDHPWAEHRHSATDRMAGSVRYIAGLCRCPVPLPPQGRASAAARPAGTPPRGPTVTARAARVEPPAFRVPGKRPCRPAADTCPARGAVSGGSSRVRVGCAATPAGAGRPGQPPRHATDEEAS